MPSVILCSPDGSWSSYYGMDNNGLGIFDMFGSSGETLASMDVTGRRPTFTSENSNVSVTFQSGAPFSEAPTDR